MMSALPLPSHPLAPPVPTLADGRPRRVGVEIEFGALGSLPAARLVARRFGGRVVTVDAHAHRVEGSRLGDFDIKLDTQYAHIEGRSGEAPDDALNDLLRWLSEVVGDVARLWLPMEVVCPPVPWDTLGEVDDLIGLLRASGAEGTEDAPYYAFGLQLNPELPATDADSLRRHLQAYVLASDWLREGIGVDRLRRLLPFARPFPRGWAALILRADYAPPLGGLIEDYLHHNPTRNRELDMLPAFAHLCPRLIAAQVADTRIKARPTFHYRLPNGSLAGPAGTISREWNRWLVVERLAAQPALIDDLAARWRANAARLIPRPWLEISGPALNALCAEGINGG